DDEAKSRRWKEGLQLEVFISFSKSKLVRQEPRRRGRTSIGASAQDRTPMPPRPAAMSRSFTQKLLVVVMLACLLPTGMQETNNGGNHPPPQANGHHHSEETNHYLQPWSASTAAAAGRAAGPADGEGPVLGANMVCQRHGRGQDTYRLLAWLWPYIVAYFLWRCAKLAYAMFVTEV
ncbi:unnamed protein product, partial [Ectocarpus sp. 12 AP-2014]